MPMPTEVFVVMSKDTTGEPRGFHKAQPHVWLSEELAEKQRQGIVNHFPSLDSTFVIVPSIIMTKDDYEHLVSELAGEKELVKELRSELIWTEDRLSELLSERDDLADQLDEANARLCSVHPVPSREP